MSGNIKLGYKLRTNEEYTMVFSNGIWEKKIYNDPNTYSENSYVNDKFPDGHNIYYASRITKGNITHVTYMDSIPKIKNSLRFGKISYYSNITQPDDSFAQPIRLWAYRPSLVEYNDSIYIIWINLRWHEDSQLIPTDRLYTTSLEEMPVWS